MCIPRIYLASASPRRHEILTHMGVDHVILTVPAPEGEDEPRLPDESPQDYVKRTALDKAIRANSWIEQNKLPRYPILTADTTVSLDGRILGKPESIQDAKYMLGCLSGKTHLVQTAVTLTLKGVVNEHLSTTQVTFDTLSAHQIEEYASGDEPWGKAGGYGIQGKAAAFIVNVNGSYSGVMGLPVYETAQLLRLCKTV